jgi:methyl acetate hydrolase
MQRIATGILALLLFGSAYADTTLPAPATIDAALDAAVNEREIPGLVAVALDKDGIFYSHASGMRDVAAHAPMQIDTIFRIASMTKPVTSVAVMMLAEEGKIGLDDPVAKHLPELANRQVFVRFTEDGYIAKPAQTAMTVRHLLTHTSGLAYAFSNATLAGMLQDTNARATDHALVHEPGERWTYGESTRVLGTLVERVSGESLEAFMRERIFEPLDMQETWYTVPADLTDRVATIHNKTPEGMKESANSETVSSPMNGDGGLNSTAIDYAKFIAMFLNGGTAPDGTRLLKQETVDLMGHNHIGSVHVSTQVSTNPALSRDFPLGSGRDTFGLGFQITGQHEQAMRSPGSMAWAGIFNTEFWIDPARGIGGVVMMQYLPFYDDVAIDTLNDFEHLLYEQID